MRTLFIDQNVVPLRRTTGILYPTFSVQLSAAMVGTIGLRFEQGSDDLDTFTFAAFQVEGIAGWLMRYHGAPVGLYDLRIDAQGAAERGLDALEFAKDILEHLQVPLDAIVWTNQHLPVHVRTPRTDVTIP